MMTTDHQTNPTGNPHWRWFPLVWVTLLIVVCMIHQQTNATQDIKNMVVQIAFLLGLLGVTIWTLRCSGLPRRLRWTLGLLPWILIGAWILQFELVNNGDLGIVGWRWRWGQAPDQRLDVPEIANQANDWQTTPHDYPRFLGTGYWAEVQGVSLETDWQTHPPREIWRRKIGAGWSSFAVVGNYAITQEQRGEKELVVCYRVLTDNPLGEIVWTHADPVRFDPGGTGALGFVGPRATPTIHGDRVFTQGATGIVNCLDARSGKRLWSHDTLTENETANIMWGKSGSPLVVDNWVVVSVGASDGRSLVAYDIETGEVAWAAGDRRSSYASPILTELAGVRQILAVNEDFITAHSMSEEEGLSEEEGATIGQVLWEHPWPGNSGSKASCSQPVPLDSDRLFLSKGYGIGSSLLQIERDAQGKFLAKPLWSPAVKPVMKTKMGNVLVRDGFVYGLDGVTLECIEIETGKKQWKKRRRPDFGHGQILLVGDVILILTEQGEVVLAEVSPERYQELASLRVFSADKITWNNPVLTGRFMLVRNAEEAACYELPLQEPENL